ncbi:epimerase, partial [Nocardia salmonicida]
MLRTAPVIAKGQPPFQQMALTTRLGLGAKLGDGRQYFPIISLRDWVGAAAHLVTSKDASGPHNLCCPVTPTNAQFTDALAAALHRKARLRVPAGVLSKAAGDLAPEVLGSVRAVPRA